MRYECVVVGAGLAGATVAERCASQLGTSVLVVEKKDHIAGLCYDCHNESDILIHKYGPHIFHTGNEAVWHYLAQFTEWHHYEHRVRAYVDGVLVPVPVNLDTVNAIHGTSLTEEELPAFLDKIREPLQEIKNAADVVLSKVGRQLYEKLFRNYTAKQWGVPPEQLSPEVTSRIPVRLNRDDRYFDDKHQGLPSEGYTKMVARMLQHPKITVMLGTDYFSIRNDLTCDHLIFTGPLDSYFDFSLGRLPYRMVRVEPETLDVIRCQPVGVVNYPNDFGFTRIAEYKHMTGQEADVTATSKEFPGPAEAGGEPSYPVFSHSALRMAEEYRRMARGNKKLFLVGRLAEYRYYNMDAVVARALEIASSIGEERQ